MGTPYIGEIRMVGFNFPPAGWAFCDGQLLPIAENESLFMLIGTIYGGDGKLTFALPNLMGRIPVHQGTGSDGVTYTLGEMGGVEKVALTTQQIPSHSHAPLGQTGAGNQLSPGNGVWAFSNLAQFNNLAADSNMATQAILPAGGSQAHDNMMPYTVISFCISLFGVIPSQT
jgi:microcystin-dependent protein